MDILEKVEKIREKTGLTYEEAKAALEQANGDLLDALVYLENQGKIKEPKVSTYSTKTESSEEFKEATQNYAGQQNDSFGKTIQKFFKWCGSMLKKSCENFFVISKDGQEQATVPILVLIVLALAFFWVVFPLMIIGLFFGFRYSFKGKIADAAVDVNTVCDKAAEAAENVKQEFTKNN